MSATNEAVKNEIIDHCIVEINCLKEANELNINTRIEVLEKCVTHIKENIGYLQTTNEELKSKKEILEKEINEEEKNILKIKREIDEEKNTSEKLETHLKSLRKIIDEKE